MFEFNLLDPDDPKGFGSRTASGRLLMHQALSDMEAAIDPAANAAFIAALQDLVGTYADKLEAMDELSIAFEVDDYDAADAALQQWQGAIDGQRAAARDLLEAARPFLSPEEIADWESALN